MEQLETRSDPARDPRGRVLATAYLALISAGAEPCIPPDTAWHPVQDLPPTAFDHGSIARSGRERLRAKLSYTNIGFALAPETFTIAQLRDIYAASVGHAISATNLQRILTRRGVIEATPSATRSAPAGRPATLYRFAARTLVVTNPFAAFRPPSLSTSGRPVSVRCRAAFCAQAVDGVCTTASKLCAGTEMLGIPASEYRPRAGLLAGRTLPTACVSNGFGKCRGATPK